MENIVKLIFYVLFSFYVGFAQNGKKITVPVSSKDLSPRVCEVEVCGKKYSLSSRDDYINAIEDFYRNYAGKLVVATYNPEFTMVKVNQGYDKYKGKKISWVDGEINPYYIKMNVEVTGVVDGLSVKTGWAPNVRYISEIDRLKKAYLSTYIGDELRILGYFKDIYDKSDFIFYCDLCDSDGNVVETKSEAVLKQYWGQNFGHKVFSFPVDKADGYSVRFRFADIAVDSTIFDKESSITEIHDAYDAETVTIQEFYRQSYGDSLEFLELGKGVYTLVYPDYINLEWKNCFVRFCDAEVNLSVFFPDYYPASSMAVGNFHPFMYKQKNEGYYEVLNMKDYNKNYNFIHDNTLYHLADYGRLYIPNPAKLDSTVYKIKEIKDRLGKDLFLYQF